MAVSSDRKNVLGAVIFVIIGFFLVLFLVGRFILPGEYQIGTEVVVLRSPDRAWQWLSHPKNWNKKIGLIQPLDESSDQEVKIGEKLSIMTYLPGGGKLTSEVVVTDLIVGYLIGDTHQVDRVNERPLPIHNVKDQFEFKPEGLGRTRIIFKETFDVEGVLNKLFILLLNHPQTG